MGSFLDPLLNPLLQPLLDMSPFWAIVVLAFVITLVITLAYKFFTDQNEMKRLKDKQNDFKQRMKELRSNPDEMMKVQKEAMSTNMEYMKHSLKVTAITMIPILLVFGWMNAHLAFEPIYPGETFSVTASFAEGVIGDAELVLDEGTTFADENDDGKRAVDAATWRLKSDAGTHILEVKKGDVSQTKKVLITKQVMYEEPVENYPRSDIESITINYKELLPLGPDFSILGWHPGWLGWYIILSIVFSIGLRKVLKIY